MTTLVLSLIIMTLVSIFLFIKYKTENKKYKDLFLKTNKYLVELNKPLRLGYYKMKCQQGGQIDYDAIVYVNEIDRYTNGDSKLRLNNFEIECSAGALDRNSAESFIGKSFVSLMKTSDITWLESENEIREQRKNKLEHLKDALK